MEERRRNKKPGQPRDDNAAEKGKLDLERDKLAFEREKLELEKKKVEIGLYVEDFKARWQDFIKVTTFVKPEVYEAAVDEAAKQNSRVVGHADSRFVGVERRIGWVTFSAANDF